ncbi:TPA: N-acetyltransferase [Candidatus Dependentiae bacterium]|nr:MAG: Acetyltransferase (GNAT) domain protein [candidate division TM6 bacterium GW2011_GWE2_31_21]KKP53922.1 MAG: Acetyltransferase (GNAT) domain protein [candidate division TM6 bacterium GW2011_GWF2_33_332]HBS47702.1 N-acetyltransferase [Candidatus Dependentiae bacterium]HBZ73851.1 N-acetyltransferase [Candidatus Dependentiae bacterium]
MKNPFLIGKNIYLSPLTKEDVNPEYVNWLNDFEVCKYNSHSIIPNNLRKTFEYVEDVEKSQTKIVFAIKWKENDKHIGNVLLQQIDWISRSAEIAILIGDKDYWNKGVGTECYNLLINYGFNSLNLNRISSGQFTENKSMIRICEKVGMEKEGILRKVFYKNGGYVDIVIYAIIKE